MTHTTHGNAIKSISNSLAIRHKTLQPIIKWPGGKEQELKHILPNLPSSFSNFYEPFIGGGAVFFAVKAKSYFINDKSSELINLYQEIQKQDKKFFFTLETIVEIWQYFEKILQEKKELLIKNYQQFSKNEHLFNVIFSQCEQIIIDNCLTLDHLFNTRLHSDSSKLQQELTKSISSKIKRMRQIELTKSILPPQDIYDNLEGAFKAGIYTYFRYLYNHCKELPAHVNAAIFFFIRNFAYSGMFRYNKSGEFNVPYGGIGYNRKNISKKINYFRDPQLVEKLSATNISSLDFADFFTQYVPTENDFIFLDPPYDSEFSTYAQNKFGQQDQIRLANYLKYHTKAKWMMVIKNTPFIYDLYANQQDLFIGTFDKKYMVSFQNRNDKRAQHLMITNYNTRLLNNIVN